MKHSISIRKELTVLKIEEEVFDFRHGNDFKKVVEELITNEQSKNLILDFSMVKAIDSCGIGSILLAHQFANRSSGLAIFVSLCKQIKDLLKLTNLDKQLYIFSSINEVITLIEPAMKTKKDVKGKAQAQLDDSMDDELLVEDLDLLGSAEIHNTPPDATLDDDIVSADDDEEENNEKDNDGDNDDDSMDSEEEISNEEFEAPASKPKKGKESSAKKRGRPKKGKLE